eukprot:CAMPEP_0196726680 /NCGR_PEP_ID=MMETSP1091-20130531/7901_1 /TAXON_ID=302021 /ORGANISM="Rhodomonas sp., Strain CCMP768" /LENGTH=125 /DNA_ID=CAMNT_0042069163 /DNA_START=17 /DNA_END=394 /DNA_ORIENTATION=-
MSSSQVYLKCKTNKSAFKAPRIVRVPSSPRDSDDDNVFQVKSNRSLVFPLCPKFDQSKLYAHGVDSSTSVEVGGIRYSCHEKSASQNKMGLDSSKGIWIASVSSSDFDRTPSLEFFPHDLTTMCR